MKIAFVYDWIDSIGGVERMLQMLHTMFPDAPFYTSLYSPEKAPWADSMNVQTSFIQHLPSWVRNSRVISAPLYPYAFEQFDFREYDVVVSISSSFAKGIITHPSTYHLSVILTPTRYLWVMPQLYRKQGVLGVIQDAVASGMRQWDWYAAQRPDQMIAISSHVQDRIRRYYNRTASVVHPPFDWGYWDSVSQNQVTVAVPAPFYLSVSRLEPYKSVDLLMKVFQTMQDKHLVVVGTGSHESYIRSIAPNNVTFLKKVSDQQLSWLYHQAQGLIMPQEEDFGYTALEAIAAGCPVLTYAESGAAEIVAEYDYGVTFSHQTVESVREALASFPLVSYNGRDHLRNHETFDTHRFAQTTFESTFRSMLTTITR